MKYWLIKSEGACYSIDDLKRDKKTAWTGVRNFQARNFMRDGMAVGDLVLFYHSNGTPRQPAGIYGIARVASAAYPDETALDRKDEHYDAKAAAYARDGKEPMWICVDVAHVRTFAAPLSLDEIKLDPALSGMLVARRGQRLSVMPVSEKHFHKIDAMT